MKKGKLLLALLSSVMVLSMAFSVGCSVTGSDSTSASDSSSNSASAGNESTGSNSGGNTSTGNTSTGGTSSTPDPEPEKNALSAIEIKNDPTKTEYYEGETFDPAGMVVVAKYTKNEDKVLKPEEYTISPSGVLKQNDKITVSYTEDGVTKTVNVQITVKANSVKTVAIKTAPTKTEYKAGEKFDPTGMVLSVTYQNGNTAEVNGTDNGVTYPDVELSVTDTTVEISYGGAKVSQIITVKDALIAIEITTQPTKTEYWEGEIFDPTGMVVTAKYGKAADRVLTSEEYTLSSTGALQAEGKVTVSYTEDGVTKTAEVNITVKAIRISSIEVTAQPTKTEYWEGEIFDPAGMVVKAHYNNGTEKELSAEEYTCPTSALSLGSQATVDVTISLVGADNITAKVSVTVKADPVTGVTIKTAPAKTKYMAGEVFDPTGMILEVTYISGKVVEIKGTDEGVEYPLTELSGTETEVEIGFGGQKTTQAIEFAQGVFIEAENGILPAGAKVVNDGDALDPNDKAHYPSGGLYVGDFKADNQKSEDERSMKFVFNSDKDGSGNISFRMASQYLKADKNWTPVVMGDCQFNKLCDLYVNNIKVAIDDSVVLKGGEAADSEKGDGALWRLWANVDFENVNLVAGRNTITLVFKEHDYNDCSRDSFNGKFTANIDSLIVTSNDCTISPCPLSVDAYKPSKVELIKETVEGKEIPYFVVTGSVDWSGYLESEVAKVLNNQLFFDFQNIPANTRVLNTSSDRSIIVTEGNEAGKGTFVMKVDVSSLATNYSAIKYSTHFGPSKGNLDHFNTETALDPANVMTDKGSFTIGSFTYSLKFDWEYSRDNTAENAPGTTADIRKEHYYGCVGILVEDGDKLTLNEATVETKASLKEKDGKVYIVIPGASLKYEAEIASNEKLKTGLASLIYDKFSCDLQGNQSKANAEGVTGSANWNRYLKNAHEIVLSEDLKSFEVWIDVTSLENYSYTTHFGVKTNNNPADFKPTEAYDQSITSNGRVYRLTVTPGSSAATDYWGCLGLKISDVVA